jgi:Holliday junction resolvase RusA-like endonuclease
MTSSDHIDITLRVCGKPKAQPRTKATAICPKGCRGRCPGQPKPKPIVRMYTPDTAEEWKQSIMLAIKPYVPPEPHDCLFAVDVACYFRRPQRMMRRKDLDQVEPHGAKPDPDNLGKAALDALTDAGFWKDDCLVCDVRVRKYYTDKRQGTGAMIRIRSIEE